MMKFLSRTNIKTIENIKIYLEVFLDAGAAVVDAIPHLNSGFVAMSGKTNYLIFGYILVAAIKSFSIIIIEDNFIATTKMPPLVFPTDNSHFQNRNIC